LNQQLAQQGIDENQIFIQFKPNVIKLVLISSAYVGISKIIKIDENTAPIDIINFFLGMQNVIKSASI
jgi:hypothetical protein